MATQTLKAAFRTDVEPILAMARQEKGGAIDPVAAYRAACYRDKWRPSGRRSPPAAAASSDRFTAIRKRKRRCWKALTRISHGAGQVQCEKFGLGWHQNSRGVWPLVVVTRAGKFDDQSRRTHQGSTAAIL